MLFNRFHSVASNVGRLGLGSSQQCTFLSSSLGMATTGFQSCRLRTRAITIFTLGFDDLLFFKVLKFLIFKLPRLARVAAPVLSTCTLAVACLTHPVRGVVTILPILDQNDITLGGVSRLKLSLTDRARAANRLQSPQSRFRRVRLSRVARACCASHSKRFALKPVDLSFGPNRLIFVINNGNDNGSALTGLVTNLCRPRSNHVY